MDISFAVDLLVCFSDHQAKIYSYLKQARHLLITMKDWLGSPPSSLAKVLLSSKPTWIPHNIPWGTSVTFQLPLTHLVDNAWRKCWCCPLCQHYNQLLCHWCICHFHALLQKSKCFLQSKITNDSLHQFHRNRARSMMLQIRPPILYFFVNPLQGQLFPTGTCFCLGALLLLQDNDVYKIDPFNCLLLIELVAYNMAQIAVHYVIPHHQVYYFIKQAPFQIQLVQQERSLTIVRLRHTWKWYCEVQYHLYTRSYDDDRQ